MQAELARQRAAALEQSNARLTAEKASHLQLLSDLEAKVEEEGRHYREARQSLEWSFKSKEALWEQQLALYKSSIEELRAMSASSTGEAAMAGARASGLEASVTELRAQLAQQSERIRELQGAGSVSPLLRSAAVGADAGSETRPVPTSKDHEARIVKLQEQLHNLGEEKDTLAKNAQLWESLVRELEVDLKSRREENQDLSQQLAAMVQQREEHQKEAEAARARAQELEARVGRLGAEAEGLRAELGAKDEQVAAARHQGEARAREAAERLEEVEKEGASSRDVATRWEQIFQEEASAHKEDIEDLAEARGRCTLLEQQLEESRRQCNDLAAERREWSHSECEEEMLNLRRRLEQAEGHAEGLAAEALRYQQHLLDLSDRRSREEGGPESLLRIALEMRRANDAGEVRRRELELGVAAREREAAALRAEAAELRRRLDGERRALEALQEQFCKQEREYTTVSQLQRIMCESRRQAARILEVEAQAQALQTDLSAERSKVAPLQEQVGFLLRKEDEAAGTRRELEAKADEWKRLHDEVVVKLDRHDVNELKRLREEAPKWQAQRAQLQARLEKLQEELRQRQEELKQRAQELQTTRALRERNEELQRQAAEMNSRIDQLVRAKAQLQESNQRKDSHCKQLDSLKTLRDKRIEELERDLKKVQDDKQKLQATADRVQAQLAATPAKAEEEVRLAQQRADRALSLGTDYHRALEVLLAQGPNPQVREVAPTTTFADRFLGLPDAQRAAGRFEDPPEHGHSTRDASAPAHPEARGLGQGNVAEREGLGGASSMGAGGGLPISATTMAASIHGVTPAAAHVHGRAAPGGADGAAGLKRRASGGEAPGEAPGGEAPVEARVAKAVRTTAPGDGAGGTAAASFATPSRDAGALAAPATLWGTSGSASSSGPGTGLCGFGIKAAASTTAPVRGAGMVVVLEEGESDSVPA